MIVAKQKLPTWKDPKTGLEWQSDSPGEMSWLEALAYPKSLALDGKTDWRLPTVAELETLLDRSVLYYELRPIVRMEVPFRDNLSYWSSTTFGPNKNNAWIVMFDGAYVLSYYKTNKYLSSIQSALTDLRNYFGFVNGMYGADENLHGNDPVLAFLVYLPGTRIADVLGLKVEKAGDDLEIILDPMMNLLEQKLLFLILLEQLHVFFLVVVIGYIEQYKQQGQ